MHTDPSPEPHRWYVISLRPRGGHAGLRRAAARHDAGLVALSPWHLRTREDDGTRAALRTALLAPRVLATSPAAVRAAASLQPLRARAGQQWFAVGSGSAAALRRAGIKRVQSPLRMDSEGLLALPGLQALDGGDFALLTAPGGRGLIAPTLQERGATVVRVDVYDRVPLAPTRQAITALRALDAPGVLALSSGEALQWALATLPGDALACLRRAGVVAASERLADAARAHGFNRVAVASGPHPAALVEAAAPLAARMLD